MVVGVSNIVRQTLPGRGRGPARRWRTVGPARDSWRRPRRRRRPKTPRSNLSKSIAAFARRLSGDRGAVGSDRETRVADTLLRIVGRSADRLVAPVPGGGIGRLEAAS